MADEKAIIGFVLDDRTVWWCSGEKIPLPVAGLGISPACLGAAVFHVMSAEAASLVLDAVNAHIHKDRKAVKRSLDGLTELVRRERMNDGKD